MKPWRDDPSDPDLARLLEAARQTEPFAPAAQERGWRRLQQAAHARGARPRAWQIAVPAAAAFALTVLLLPRLLHRPPAPPLTPDPDPPTALEAQADARFEGAGAAQTLVAGTVVARAGAHLRTRQLQLWVETGRCRVQVAGEQTELLVLEGSARLQAEGAPLQAISSGTRLRFGPGAAAVPAPAVPADGCAPLPDPEARRGCYAHAALGAGLAAENALFALGQLDQEAHRLDSALQYFQSYLQRYPDGALAPEATAGVLTARLEQRAWPQALAAADAYLARVPHGGRGPEVRLIRANLLREHAGQLRAALAGYRELLGGDVPPAVRSEALFGEALVCARLGDAEGARAALAAYAQQFPAGPHAAEVARMQRP